MKFKIYTFTKAAKEEIINDRFEGKDIVVFYKSGTVSALDARELNNSKDIGSVTVFNANFKGTVLEFYFWIEAIVSYHLHRLVLVHINGLCRFPQTFSINSLNSFLNLSFENFFALLLTLPLSKLIFSNLLIASIRLRLFCLLK